MNAPHSPNEANSANNGRYPESEYSQDKPKGYFCSSDPLNHLRVLADFRHMPRQGIRRATNVNDVYDEVIATSTALEFLMVILNGLEDHQVRADYLRCLIEPHVSQLCRTVEDLSELVTFDKD
jgi:hypothetical protein